MGIYTFHSDPLSVGYRIEQDKTRQYRLKRPNRQYVFKNSLTLNLTSLAVYTYIHTIEEITCLPVLSYPVLSRRNMQSFSGDGAYGKRSKVLDVYRYIYI